MKNILRILVFLALINLINSCSSRVSSPWISVTNQSNNYIRNIKGSWNGYGFGGWLERAPGNSASENFILEKKSDIYGLVHIEWENAEGGKIVKEFTFTKEMFPDFRIDHRCKTHGLVFGHIYFFLTQEDIKMLIDPTGKGSEEIKKERQIAVKFTNDFIKNCPKQYGCDLTKTNVKQQKLAKNNIVDSYQDERGIRVIKISSPDVSNPKIRKSCTKKDLELYQLKAAVEEVQKNGIPYGNIPQDQQPSVECLKAITGK